MDFFESLLPSFYGKDDQSREQNVNNDLQIIKQLNALSMPELKTFIQTTDDDHVKKIAVRLYNQKLDADPKTARDQYQKNYDESGESIMF